MAVMFGWLIEPRKESEGFPIFYTVANATFCELYDVFEEAEFRAREVTMLLNVATSVGESPTKESVLNGSAAFVDGKRHVQWGPFFKKDDAFHKSALAALAMVRR